MDSGQDFESVPTYRSPVLHLNMTRNLHQMTHSRGQYILKRYAKFISKFGKHLSEICGITLQLFRGDKYRLNRFLPTHVIFELFLNGIN